MTVFEIEIMERWGETSWPFPVSVFLFARMAEGAEVGEEGDPRCGIPDEDEG